MAGEFITDDKVNVNTPLAKQVLVSSITHLLDILGRCSQWEADEICQIKGKIRDMHQGGKEHLLLSHQQEKQLLIQEGQRQKELERLEGKRMLEENQRRQKELANKQMAQLHVQYMAAHRQVTG